MTDTIVNVGDLVCWRAYIGELLGTPTTLRVWKVTPDLVYTTSVNSGNRYTDAPSALCTAVEWYAESCRKAGSEWYLGYVFAGTVYCLRCVLAHALDGDVNKMETFYQYLRQRRPQSMPEIEDVYSTDDLARIPERGLVCNGCSEELYPDLSDPDYTDPLDGRLSLYERI